MSLVTWFGADRLLTTLEAALAGASAEQVEISATSRVGHHTRFAGERIHQAQSITECQVMVRAVVGTGSARVAVNSLEHVPRAVAEAGTLARSRNGIDAAEVPMTLPRARSTTTRRVYGPRARPRGMSAARSRLAGSIMAEARKAGGTVNGTLTVASTELAVVTSRGVRAHGAGTEAGFTMTVRFGEASSYIGDLSRDAGTLDVQHPRRDAIGATAQVRELVPVPDGVHDVVFGPLAAGELVGFVPDFGFTAPALRAGIGLVAQHRGEAMAPEFVTIADDAGAGVGLPFPFDFEGSAKQRVLLIDRGRVGDAVSDRASAAVTGGVSTGHASIGREQSPEPACANLVMVPGTQSEDELIAGIEHGLYVQRLWYNRLVDAEAGTVVGTSRDGCFLIEEGRRTQALAGGRFNESIIDALRRTDALSSLRYSQPIPNLWNSCITAPAIRVRGFCFGSRTRLRGGLVNVTSNVDRLLTQVLAGEVWPPLGDRNAYRIDPDGRAFFLPGMGGVTLDVHVGDPATGYAGDHVEPGLSVRHREPDANYALQYLSCIGNRVEVTSGRAKGAAGFVIGQHAYVLVDMDGEDMSQVTVGDGVSVFAVGQGLVLDQHPDVVVKNCSPALLTALAHIFRRVLISSCLAYAWRIYIAL